MRNIVRSHNYIHPAEDLYLIKYRLLRSMCGNLSKHFLEAKRTLQNVKSVRGTGNQIRDVQEPHMTPKNLSVSKRFVALFIFYRELGRRMYVHCNGSVDDERYLGGSSHPRSVLLSNACYYGSLNALIHTCYFRLIILLGILITLRR